MTVTNVVFALKKLILKQVAIMIYHKLLEKSDKCPICESFMNHYKFFRGLKKLCC